MRFLYIAILLIIHAGAIYGQSQYENLVFEGAGIRGLAYSGVVKGLEEKNILKDIKRVGGTSAGAITAMMLSIGYNSEEIYSIISETAFQKFNKGGFGAIGGVSRMKSRFGWYKHDKFEKWLEENIAAKTGNAEITFIELVDQGYLELYVTGTSLNKQEMIVFNSKTYPNMKIKDAIQASMSIPLYFGAKFIDAEGQVYDQQVDGMELDIIVDGGIVGNFPIEIFDSFETDSSGRSKRVINHATLGVRIDSDEQIMNDGKGLGLVNQEITDFRSYIQAFYVMILENLNRNRLTESDWDRTLSVSSVGIGPRIKRLSEANKKKLAKSGEEAVEQFFKEL